MAQLPEIRKLWPDLWPPQAVFIHQNLTGKEWVTWAVKSTNIAKRRLWLIPATGKLLNFLFGSLQGR